MPISLEQARKTKPKVQAAASACSAAVVGVGLTRIGDSYAVKVNLRERSVAAAGLPERVDGVQVVYEVVGQISPNGLQPTPVH